MNYLLAFIYASLACAGFCVMFNLQNYKIAVFACIGGGIEWVVCLWCAAHGGSLVFQNLIAAITVAAYSEIMARVFKAPSTVFLIVGILPIVPGRGIYFTMKYCIQGDIEMFIKQGLDTFSVAGAIAVGVSLVSSVVRIISASKYINNKKSAS